MTLKGKKQTKHRGADKKSRLTQEPLTHLKQLDPIPSDAHTSPVTWADKHIESLVPQSAKEIEYGLKFGDAKTRLNLALEIMAMKGISSKGPQVGQVVPAIQLIMPAGTTLPWEQAKLGATPKVPELIEGEVVAPKAETKND